jgi:flagellar motor switch protein FliG
MAQSLREEISARGKIKDKDAEEAMTAVILAIRQLEGSGEVVLVTPEE